MDSILQSLSELRETFREVTASSTPVWVVSVLATSLVTAALLNWLFKRVLSRLAKRTRTDLDDRLIALLRRPLYVSAILVGLWLVTRRFDLPPLANSLAVGALQTAGVIVWSIFAARASVLLVDAVASVEEKTSLIKPRSLPLFEKTAQIAVFGASLYFLLHVWGIDVGAWLVSAGVVGIAVGFAAKDTLANLFSGIFILADAPYAIGDWIVLDTGERGAVQHIGLRSTRLLTRDDIEIVLPNAVIANAKITNESGGPWEKERVRIPVGVAYGSDADRVTRILQEIAEGHPDIGEDPEPRVRFRAFGDSALEFELLGWIDEPILRGRVLHELNMSIYKRFSDAGIEIPFPKRDVYLHQVPETSPE